MNILVEDPTYPQEEERAEEFRRKLEEDLRACFDGSVKMHDVDAGPSASIPAILLQGIGSSADAIAIFSAPLVIGPALKWWKHQFQKIAAFLKERDLSYSIDTGSAAALAVDQLALSSRDDDELRIASVTRHWINLNGSGSDHRYAEELAISKVSATDQQEMVKTLNVRYLVLLERGTRAFTAVVERDGTVAHLAELQLEGG